MRTRKKPPMVRKIKTQWLNTLACRTFTLACPSSCTGKRTPLSATCASYPISRRSIVRIVVISISEWRPLLIHNALPAAVQSAEKAFTAGQKTPFRVVGIRICGPISVSASWRAGLPPVLPKRWALHTRQEEVFARGKGVAGDCESEGNARQNADLTNRRR